MEKFTLPVEGEKIISKKTHYKKKLSNIKKIVITFYLLCILLCPINVNAYDNAGNRYGIDASHGAYSTQNPFCNTYCGQCTAFAWGRALDRLGIAIAFSQATGRNACNWPNIISNPTPTLQNDPRKNSIAVWATSTCDGNNPGHVAYVEEVEGNYVYINEANVVTYQSTNYGGGYDGFTKRFLVSELSDRGNRIGELQGYIYLDSSFSDYQYWDFDTQGTEDWNAREALNQGIALDEYWQIGSSFGDNNSKRGIVSPTLNAIHTNNYDAIEIKFGINNRYLEQVEAYIKIDNDWKGPINLSYISGPRTTGSQNIYRGNINFTGQIQQIRIDFDIGIDFPDVRIYIDYVEFTTEQPILTYAIPWIPLLLLSDSLDLNRGLVAHYPFNGNAIDASGNNYHGTEHNGVSYVDGLIGQAASLDGVDDYITLPYSETILGTNPSEWSYSAWILTNEDPEGMTIITDYYSNIWDELFGINLQVFETNQIRTECRKSLSTKNPIYSNTVIQDGIWNFVTVVVSKPESKVKLYLNGAWENETTIDSGVDYIEAVPVRIGCNFYYGNTVAHFNGKIDEVRLYNRALSASEIQALYDLGN